MKLPITCKLDDIYHDFADLAEECDRLRAINKQLVDALELPFKWEKLFDAAGGEASDKLLNSYGWNERSSPDEFMRKYAKNVLAAAKEKP